MEEVWKEIIGYEGIYQVSDQGRIKSLANSESRKEKILKTHLRGGYPQVELYYKGVSKKKAVHRIVAESFIPNPVGYPVINHKDGVKSNAAVDNLEWCTQQQNIWHAMYTLKDNKKPPDEILKEKIEQGVNQLLEKFHLSREQLKLYI